MDENNAISELEKSLLKPLQRRDRKAIWRPLRT